MYKRRSKRFAAQKTLKTFIHSIVLLLLAILCGTAANTLGPKKIAWQKNWDSMVLSKADEEGIGLVSIEEVGVASETFSATLLDARSNEDYNNGHIPGALSLPLKEFDLYFPETSAFLSELAPIIVYCSGLQCDEALDLTIQLRDMGFQNLRVFAEGWEAWEQSGGPIE